MNDLNEVLIEGRLVCDPKFRQIGSSAIVCTFIIASNLRFIDKESGQLKERATFVLVETWKKVAEACLKHLKKGDGVRVAGMLRQSHWEKEPGIKLEKTFILAEHVDFKTKAAAPTTGAIKATDEEPSENEQKEINSTMINQETPEVNETPDVKDLQENETSEESETTED